MTSESSQTPISRRFVWMDAYPSTGQVCYDANTGRGRLGGRDWPKGGFSLRAGVAEAYVYDRVVCRGSIMGDWAIHSVDERKVEVVKCKVENELRAYLERGGVL